MTKDFVIGISNKHNIKVKLFFKSKQDINLKHVLYFKVNMTYSKRPFFLDLAK